MAWGSFVFLTLPCLAVSQETSDAARVEALEAQLNEAQQSLEALREIRHGARHTESWRGRVEVTVQEADRPDSPGHFGQGQQRNREECDPKKPLRWPYTLVIVGEYREELFDDKRQHQGTDYALEAGEAGRLEQER